MNKIILGDKEYTLSPDLVKQLEQLVATPEKTGRWVPEKGGYYYFVESGSGIGATLYDPGNHEDEFRISQNNAFWSHGEAQTHLTYLKALATIKEDAEWWVPDWDDNDEPNFFGGYQHYNSRVGLFVDWSSTVQYEGTIYFETKEKLEQSFRTHRSEWLCVFGVSDE